MPEDEKNNAKLKVAGIIREYRERYPQGAPRSVNEENTKNWLDSLFEALGWSIRHDTIKEEASGKRKRVDYSFKIDGTTKFLLEAKKPSEDLDDHIAQAVGYGYQNSKKWVVLSNFEETRVYNAQYHDQPEEVKRLFKPLTIENYLERFDDLWVLSKPAFKAGLIEEIAEKYGKIKPTAPVTKILAEDLGRWRETLTKSINVHRAANGVPEDALKAEEFIDEAVQRILDRILFVRVTEDKGIEEPRLEKALRDYEAHGKPLIGYLKQVFREMDATYNSGLFREHYSEDLKIDDDVLAKVIKETIKNPKGLRYNFDAIDADILGSVYEQYLSVLLKKTDKRASLKESKGKRKEQGIYYTPTYIVDYIVKNTLGEALKGKTPKEVQKLKVLDPACGSGSFLIKAFDEINDYYKKQTGQTKLNQESAILADNLYGVDLDLKAVEIARLNLLLKAAETKHKLPALEGNIKCGNSLIDDPAVAGERAFDWNKEFKEVMADGGFDVIIGNPPWTLEISELEKKHLQSKFETAEGKPDLYRFFMERGIQLLKPGGLFGFIVPNSWLSMPSAKKLRESLLTKTKIESITVLPQGVFDIAMNYVVFILRKTKPKDEDTVLVNNIETITDNTLRPKTRFFRKQQDWKINQDRIFSVEVNEEQSKMLTTMSQKSTSLENVAEIALGIQAYHNTKHTPDEIKNRVFHSDRQLSKQYVPELGGKDVGRYFFKFDGKNWVKYGDWLYCAPPTRFFEGERIVLREIPGKTLIATLITAEYYCTYKTVLNIRVTTPEYNSKYVLGVINSKAMSYFVKNSGSKSTQELFPRVSIKNLKTLPIPQANEAQQREIIQRVDILLKNKQKIASVEQKTDERARFERENEEADQKIDELVYDLYGLTKEEREIVEKSVEK
ncbi:MAG: N-6 DNA methylase [Candidatus Micrarchaeia archaeon]